MQRLILLIYSMFALAILPAVSLNANDPASAKPSEPDAAIPPFDYKLGLRLFMGYEFADSDASGAPDQRGPTRSDTGFWMERGFISFDGRANEGFLKGWSANLTTDFTSPANLGDGCGGDDICEESNEYALTLRQAYINIPLAIVDGLSLRIGQQESAIGHGAAGYRMTSVWDHRYLSQRAHLQEAGLHEPVDRGVALIWKNPYGGLHLLYSNGESLERNNAENVQRDSLDSLARGAGDSYAMDLQGMLHLKPTGENENWRWIIGLPWRLHNITALPEDESRYFSADLDSNGAPRYFYLSGDARAKRDVTYGLVSDLSYRSGLWQWSVGGGVARFIDRRGDAFRIDDTLLQSPINSIDPNDYLKLESDAYGFMRYAWIHLRYGNFGIVGRYIVQSQVDRLQRRLQARSGKGWLQQIVEADLDDRAFGNLTPNQARLAVDTGQGKVHNVVYGITYYPHPRLNYFRITFGVTELSGEDYTGRGFQRSVLERFDGAAFGVDTNLRQQLEGSPQVAAALGLPPNETLILNDYVGREFRIREVFLRAEFRY